MRPLHHPNLKEITVEGVLHALSDPLRARIYARLAASDSAQICSAFVNVKEAPLPKSTLSHQFRILREAGLIRSEKRGVELYNRTRCEELKTKFGPLIESVLKAYMFQEAVKKGKKNLRSKK